VVTGVFSPVRAHFSIADVEGISRPRRIDELIIRYAAANRRVEPGRDGERQKRNSIRCLLPARFSRKRPSAEKLRGEAEKRWQRNASMPH